MRGKELAEKHWEYIESLFTTHKAEEDIVEICKFHYITAFIHGYGHGYEDCIDTLAEEEEINSIPQGDLFDPDHKEEEIKALWLRDLETKKTDYLK